MIVSKKVSFDAAHYLPNYTGQCANMHGHTWTVEVGVKGEVNPDTGMVIDFSILSKIIKKAIQELDHDTVNKYIEIPTAENIAKYIQQEMLFNLQAIDRNNRPTVAFIRVWETPDSCCELQ